MSTDLQRSEVAVLAGAVSAAPSVHSTQPWVLEVRGDTATLFERLDRALPRHDPTGRDRLLSCGAALANLVVAARYLGWAAEPEFVANPWRPDLLATVTLRERHAPSPTDLATYTAIRRRRSHRARFAPVPVSENLAELVRVGGSNGAFADQIDMVRASASLAELLIRAAARLRDDREYQDELSAWIKPDGVLRPGNGIPESAVNHDSASWATLIRRHTILPERDTLAAKLAVETMLIVQTRADRRHDQIRAGMALQRCWLVAVRLGLAGSVLTQPLHLREVRACLVDALQLTGYPQAILRVGYPQRVLQAEGALAGVLGG